MTTLSDPLDLKKYQQLIKFEGNKNKLILEDLKEVNMKCNQLQLQILSSNSLEQKAQLSALLMVENSKLSNELAEIKKERKKLILEKLPLDLIERAHSLNVLVTAKIHSNKKELEEAKEKYKQLEKMLSPQAQIVQSLSLVGKCEVVEGDDSNQKK